MPVWSVPGLTRNPKVCVLSITIGSSMFRAISLCLLGALLLGAADAPPKSAFDKPTLEAYVRHLYLLQPQLTVTVGDPKPSNLPGFKEVRVRIAQGRAIPGPHAVRLQRRQEDRPGQLLRRHHQSLQARTR